jgi:hypothetical protein
LFCEAQQVCANLTFAAIQMVFAETELLAELLKNKGLLRVRICWLFSVD